jgi:hypothetical protein
MVKSKGSVAQPCCFEGMEEYGSEGLDDFIQAESKKYFKDTDAVCISDNYWLGTEKPCLTYGLRGCTSSVRGATRSMSPGIRMLPWASTSLDRTLTRSVMGS